MFAALDPRVCVVCAGWIALFQFLFAIPLLFPSAVASNVAIKHLPDNLLNGAKVSLCLLLARWWDFAHMCDARALLVISLFFSFFSPPLCWQCLGMIDSVKNSTAVVNGTMLLGSTSSDLHIDNCNDSPIYVSIYLVCRVACWLRSVVLFCVHLTVLWRW